MSSMAELMAQMKAKKAQVATPIIGKQETSMSTSVNKIAEAVAAKPSLMEQLDRVKDKPIDYVGETIDSQPRVFNPDTEGAIVKNRILKLSQALEKEIPDYAHILHTIHKALSKDDELTHLLTDDEVGVLIRAMKHRKNVVLVEEKNKKSAKKPLSKTTLDDIL